MHRAHSCRSYTSIGRLEERLDWVSGSGLGRKKMVASAHFRGLICESAKVDIKTEADRVPSTSRCCSAVCAIKEHHTSALLHALAGSPPRLRPSLRSDGSGGRSLACRARHPARMRLENALYELEAGARSLVGLIPDRSWDRWASCSLTVQTWRPGRSSRIKRGTSTVRRSLDNRHLVGQTFRLRSSLVPSAQRRRLLEPPVSDHRADVAAATQFPGYRRTASCRSVVRS